MRNVVMFVMEVLMCVAGAAIMETNFWGENITTERIVFGIIGIVFIATSRTSKKLLQRKGQIEM